MYLHPRWQSTLADLEQRRVVCAALGEGRSHGEIHASMSVELIRRQHMVAWS